MTTELLIFTTLAPSAPPTSVNISSVTSTSITVKWGTVDCIHRNGNITNYSVQYGIYKGVVEDRHARIISGDSGERLCLISGLTSSTNYFIEVAAVNRAGTGVYSSPRTVLTLGKDTCATELNVPLYQGSSITYNWTQTKAGNKQTQRCPDICQDFFTYPTGAAVVRECRHTEINAEWRDADISRCGIDELVLQLCLASQVKELNPLVHTIICSI